MSGALRCAAVVCLVLAAAACSRAETKPSPEQVAVDYLSAKPTDYATGVPLETPVRMPSSDDGRLRIVVYLTLPSVGEITGASLQELKYPKGTRADRVEYLAPANTPLEAVPSPDWLVADVRGLVMFDSFVEHHFFRPATVNPTGPLRGAKWDSHDEVAHARATQVLRGLAQRGDILGPTVKAEREGFAERLAKLNDCNGCHVRGKAENSRTSDAPVVRRMSDGDAFYQVGAVFHDEDPLEVYRPRDLNADDPKIRLRCATGQPSPRVGHAAPQCADGSVPRARYQLREALLAHDARAERICAARRYIASHMSPSARAVVQGALDDCRVDSMVQ